jgi:hypothetical protein
MAKSGLHIPQQSTSTGLPQAAAHPANAALERILKSLNDNSIENHSHATSWGARAAHRMHSPSS